MAQAPPVVRVIAQSLSTPPQPPSRQVPRSSTVIGGLCEYLASIGIRYS